MEGNKVRRIVKVCQGTGCIAGGSDKVLPSLKEEIKRNGLETEVEVKFTGCHGFCQEGPIVDVDPEGTFYTRVRAEDAPEIVASHLRGGRPVERLFYRDPLTGRAIARYQEVPFYAGQQRLILSRCGHINPEDINEFLATGGYEALHKALLEMTPEQVIAEVKRSGLRGRGGAGFPTGQKWEFCRASPGPVKFVICNADEGDPGAFMDRSILEADPHSVIEGLAICGYAIGASRGFFYVRAEYPLAVKRLRIGLQRARERGFLGEKILGSGFSFDIEIREGAGAFVCGEETALMASIEGRRGMPRPRPPFPAQKGLWGRPTNINNVKTLASVPLIIHHGADWYGSIGTEKGRGTLVFALTGKIANSGLVEVPLGTPLHHIIYDIGGGVMGNRRIKAVQTGGPSGGCLPAHLMDLPVEYETLAQAGSIVGSGGMVTMDEDTCIVDIARFFITFTQKESCGKCVPCRVGTRQMLGMLEAISRGEAVDLAYLEKLARQVNQTSLCGLGQTAPNPVLTTLKYFPEEFQEHIEKKYCRAAVCKGLVKAPCHHLCPAGVEAYRYVRLCGQGKFTEALLVNREKIPFPAVLGRVCVHFCETRCTRGKLEEPIAIRALKKVAADHYPPEEAFRGKRLPPSGKRVAVVGAGPAGLTCAYYLAKLGHQVTVFEALPLPGGMMRVGIPEYRLPRDVLDREIQYILHAGVELRTNSRVDSPEQLLQQGYHAVFLGLGAHRGMRLGLEGEDGLVKEAVAFLREVNLGQKVAVGEKVAVIGGGNAAIDAARTARRLGAREVTLLYRRTQAEMPALPEEVEEALKEGIKLVVLVAPLRVGKENGRLNLVCQQMKLGAFDKSGRRRPEPVAGSEFSLQFDTVVAAIGQAPDLPKSLGLGTESVGTMKVDPRTLATSRPGVFAGGDCVLGPASVIEAIAQGRNAASAIDRYLGGTGDIEEQLLPTEVGATPAFPVDEGEKYRPPMSTLPAEGRANFEETELGYSPAQAMEEARRCLNCDLEKR